MTEAAKPIPSKNVTMVILAEHHAPLRAFLETVHEQVRELVCVLGLPKDFFVVHKRWHKTFLGLEVVLDRGRLIGAWFLQNNQECREIRPRELIKILDIFARARGKPLLKVRFGGFRRSWCYCEGELKNGFRCATSDGEFHAFGRTAYQGSAYGSSDGPLIITGWPVAAEENQFTRDLYRFRLACENASYLDKYHAKTRPFDRDDDAYIRLGTLGPYPDYVIDIFVDKLRGWLSAHEPKILEFNLEDLWIVHYERPSLETNQSEKRVVEIIAKPEMLDDLYEEWRAGQAR